MAQRNGDRLGYTSVTNTLFGVLTKPPAHPYSGLTPLLLSADWLHYGLFLGLSLPTQSSQSPGHSLSLLQTKFQPRLYFFQTFFLFPISASPWLMANTMVISLA